MNQLSIGRFPELDYACGEAMNTLCTNLFYCGENIRSVLLTSRYEQEGMSSIAMNVMRTLAGYGKRVVLVDADMRRSHLVHRYGMTTTGELTGLAHYLAGQCELEDAIYETNVYGACIIPAGRDVSNPLPLIDSPYFGAMLNELANAFDLVIVDAPPVGVVIDAAVMAKECDGCVFVVEYNKTRRRDLSSAKHQMEQSGCQVLGTIINKVTFDSLSEKKYYNKGYYKQYANDYGRKPEKK